MCVCWGGGLRWSTTCSFHWASRIYCWFPCFHFHLLLYMLPKEKGTSFIIYFLICNLKKKDDFYVLAIDTSVYLKRMVYTTRVLNLCFFKRVMIYQMLSVRNIFDTVPRLNASVIYYQRFSSFPHYHIYYQKLI